MSVSARCIENRNRRIELEATNCRGSLGQQYRQDRHFKKSENKTQVPGRQAGWHWTRRPSSRLGLSAGVQYRIDDGRLPRDKRLVARIEKWTAEDSNDCRGGQCRPQCDLHPLSPQDLADEQANGNGG